LDRIVLPMSSLASWAMILMGGLTSLIVVGVNVQPLLAFGGVSGIAIGLGAQQVTANLVAGINLVSALWSQNCLPATSSLNVTPIMATQR
jgi:small-conductance mechanosensitive channel